MKRVLLACALLLSGCAVLAPSATTTADPGGAALSLKPMNDYKIVRFDAGTLPAQDVVLTLSGVKLSVNDPTCKATESQLVCKVGNVIAQTGYVLPARGVAVVEAEYKRRDSATVYKLATD